MDIKLTNQGVAFLLSHQIIIATSHKISLGLGPLSTLRYLGILRRIKTQKSDYLLKVRKPLFSREPCLLDSSPITLSGHPLLLAGQMEFRRGL